MWEKIAQIDFKFVVSIKCHITQSVFELESFDIHQNWSKWGYIKNGATPSALD